MNNQEKPKVLKWSLIIALVILINLFYNYSISLVFDAPEFDQYCDRGSKSVLIDDEAVCLENGGQWEAIAVPVRQIDLEARTGYCDVDHTCREEYQDARDSHEKNVFIILIVLGVMTFAASLMVGMNYVMSVSLGLAAVLDLIIASMRYWSSADELLKVVILGLALVILIWIGIKKFSDK